MKATNLIGKKVSDSENNIFTIQELTYDLNYKHDGYSLRSSFGEKEISKYDLQFYTLI